MGSDNESVFIPYSSFLLSFVSPLYLAAFQLALSGKFLQRHAPVHGAFCLPAVRPVRGGGEVGGGGQGHVQELSPRDSRSCATDRCVQVGQPLRPKGTCSFPVQFPSRMRSRHNGLQCTQGCLHSPGDGQGGQALSDDRPGRRLHGEEVPVRHLQAAGVLVCLPGGVKVATRFAACRAFAGPSPVADDLWFLDASSLHSCCFCSA